MKSIADIISVDRVINLKRSGVLILDVDDTILARSPRPGGPDSVFADSVAAQQLVELLQCGVRIAFVTGHGWEQLKDRLIEPLIESLSPIERSDAAVSIFIYANRGATRIDVEENTFAEDKAYGIDFGIKASDAEPIRNIFRALGNYLMEQYFADPAAFQISDPNFPFDRLPPKMTEREDTVIALRPVPNKRGTNHVRDELVELGRKLLAENGLADDYQITACGRSTIEIMRRGVEKSVAVTDLFNRLSVSLSKPAETIQSSSLFVGDEFGKGGNDRSVLEKFGRCTCVSVAAVDISGEMNLVDATALFDGDSVTVCSGLIQYIHQTLVQHG